MSGRALIVACCLMAAATPASAQFAAFDARGYFTYGAAIFSAAETLDAVADKHHAASIGGGVVLTLWRGLFVDVGLSQQTLEGTRVFVLNGDVFKLGIPLKVRFRPLDVAVGWRTKRGRFSPYGGIGVSRMNYEETSDFAAAGDNVSAARTGVLVMGGVDVPVWRWVHAGGELRYRYITGILGAGGASDDFNEDRLGGVAAALRISVGR